MYRSQGLSARLSNSRRVQGHLKAAIALHRAVPMWPLLPTCIMTTCVHIPVPGAGVVSAGAGCECECGCGCGCRCGCGCGCRCGCGCGIVEPNLYCTHVELPVRLRLF